MSLNFIMLSFAAITPHPPIIIPTIGSREDLLKVKKTINEMEELRKKMEKAKPETLIIISPHGPVGFKELSILESDVFTGNFSMFGDFETQLSFKGDLELSEKLKKEYQRENIVYRVYKKEDLDHGALVSLFYLLKNIKTKILPISYSLLDLGWNFKYGNAIGKVIKKSERKIGIIASGDLSHRLTKDAPAGYSPLGKKFDEKIVEGLKNNDIKNILNIDENLAEEAGECGLRSIAILLGALSTINNWRFEILSYECPFGVGYLVANVKSFLGSGPMV